MSQPIHPAIAPSTPGPFSTARPWRIVVAGCLLVLAYYPALHGGILWDDDRHVTQPALRSAEGLVRIWTEIGATQQYYPLLHSAFWLEHRIWGDATVGYHLVNLLQHGLAAVLFALVLQRLLIPGAWLAAALFALHPVHVESVGWISEQKNTLSLVFFLGATLLYLRFDDERKTGFYLAALGMFGLGLLTKTTTATLPGLLLVVAWWRRGCLSWRRDFLPMLPWIVLGGAAGLSTAWLEQSLIGAEGEAFELTWRQRLLVASRAVWFYLSKLIWPANLTFIYPRWMIDPANAFQWFPFVALAGVLVAAFQLRRSSRAPLAIVLLFIGGLFPALGFFNVYPFQYSFVADHFQYAASLPVIAGAAAGLHRICPLFRPRRVLAPILLGASVVLTWQQCRMYRDLRTLYATTIARNPACWMAHNNLGKELMVEKPRLPEAIAHFNRALALRPNYPEALNNLGLALTQAGRPRDAIPYLERSLQLKPGVYQAHNNLGIALASSGRAEDALAAFAAAATLNPRLPNIHENWAKALLLLNRRAEAEQRFAHAAELVARPSPPISPPKRP